MLRNNPESQVNYKFEWQVCVQLPGYMIHTHSFQCAIALEHLCKCWVRQGDECEERMKGWKYLEKKKNILTYFVIRVRVKPESQLHNFSETRVWKQVLWACVLGTALLELFSFWIYSSRLCSRESSFAALRCFLEKIVLLHLLVHRNKDASHESKLRLDCVSLPA